MKAQELEIAEEKGCSPWAPPPAKLSFTYQEKTVDRQAVREHVTCILSYVI